MSSASPPLPRLLHVGEVNVEESFHGSLLLFRLLRDYPPDRLTIIETSLEPSTQRRRLPDVTYLHCPLRLHRFFHNRWSQRYAILLRIISRLERAPLRRCMQNLSFDAVSTVAHGWSWLEALFLASERGVPSHLILHDDWPTHTTRSPFQQGILRNTMKFAYRTAASRFCVSPAMELAYQKSTGCTAEVLYPARSSAVSFDVEPASHLIRDIPSLRIAYAGTISAAGYPELIAQTAVALDKIGGKLILYTPQDSITLQRQGLDLPFIESRAAVPSSTLIETLRREADALLLPMSFDPAVRDNMTLAFPSKLADYSAVGLPILILAPDYSSVARWAVENPDAALLVTSSSDGAIHSAVERLQKDPALRVSLARGAITAGQKYFNAARARDTFLTSVMKAA